MIERLFDWYERQDFATQAVIHGGLIAVAAVSFLSLATCFIFLLANG